MQGGEKYCRNLKSPIGLLRLCAGEEALLSVSFAESDALDEREELRGASGILDAAESQLSAYFRGELRRFDLPLKYGGTDFQNRVWKQLSTIPFADTISYLTLARKLGDALSIRAAASANGKNPFAILIPCHRVIGSDGSLTGYSGGIWRKQWLLDHESRTAGKLVTLF